MPHKINAFRNENENNENENKNKTLSCKYFMHRLSSLL